VEEHGAYETAWEYMSWNKKSRTFARLALYFLPWCFSV